jgi:uncharacterized protein
MKRLFVCAGIAAITTFCGYSQDIAGDWQGTLKAGPVELRLLFHISKTDNGGWQGTMDSIDQAANGLRLASIKLKDSKLSFAVPSVRGLYDGKVNAAGTAIEGLWSQGEPLPLNLTHVPPTPKPAANAPPPVPSDIDGAWKGTLHTGSGDLRLVFHISTTQNGLAATMDSLDQDATGLPATSVARTGATLNMEFKQLGGKFEGSIYKGPASIVGTWTQLGASFQLELTPAAK